MSALGTLLLQRLRRDRWQLVAWVAAIGLMTLFSAAAIYNEYGTDETRIAVLKIAVANPSILVVRGLASESSAGAMIAFEVLTFIAILACLMSTLLAVRHSRADEESGRAELVSATRAGRLAPTVATAIEGVIANVLVIIVIALALASTGLEPGGSFVFALGAGGAGLTFLGVGLICSQIFSTSRGANGAATALVGIAYMLRGAADADGTIHANGYTMTSAWPSWLSPIGWAEQMLPYVDNLVWPFLLDVGVLLVFFAATIALQAVRDSGAGLVAARSGRATASGILRGPIGLAWRLQRGSVISWGIGAILLALFVGSIAANAGKTFGGDSSVTNVIKSLVPGGSGEITRIVIAAMMGVLGLVVAGCVLQIVMRLRQEEALGTAEVVLATRVGRIRWYFSYLWVGLVAAVVILFVSGVVAGLVLVQNGGATELFGQALGAAMAQLPAVVFYLGALGLVFAVVPRATIPVGWVLFGISTFLGEFGGMMKLPEWVRNLSPSVHTPAVPLSGVDWSGAWWMVGIAIVAAVLGAILVRRRDVVTA
jgi:ABC-2 type transport system permease protein